MAHEASASADAAVLGDVPSAYTNQQMKDDASRFQADIDFLRARDCRCPLRWAGERAVPATICEESQSSGLCAKRMIVQGDP